MACSSIRYYKQRFYNACYTLKLFILVGLFLIAFTVIKNKNIGTSFSVTRKSHESMFSRRLDLLRKNALGDFRSGPNSSSDTAREWDIREGVFRQERPEKTIGILQETSRGEDRVQGDTVTLNEAGEDVVTNERAKPDITTVSSQGEENHAKGPVQGQFSPPVNDTTSFKGVVTKPDISRPEQFPKMETSSTSLRTEQQLQGALTLQQPTVKILTKSEILTQREDTASTKNLNKLILSSGEQVSRTLTYPQVPSKNYKELLKMFQTEAALEREAGLFEVPEDESPLRRYPQCVIIGFAKCGTRALIGYMEMHPYVRIALTEPHFYDQDEVFKKGYDQYLARMPNTYSNQVTIEKTPEYVMSFRALQEIRKNFPETKLIAIMKDPVERLVSQYMQANRFSMHSPSPLHMFYRHRDGSFSPNVPPVDVGVYHKHLRPWIETFPRKQFLFVDGHQLIRDPLTIVKKVETFLKIPSLFKYSNFVFNVTRGFFCRRRFGESEIKCLTDYKGFEHPKMRPEDELMLRAFYGPNNVRLYKMIGETFSW